MPRRINRRKARTWANDGDGQQNKKRAGKRELWKCRGCGKRGKPKTGFPLFPQPLGNLAKNRRDSHISTAPAEAGGWESGKPKAGFPLSHRHESLSSGRKIGAAGRASPSARRRALRAALRVKE